MKINVKHCARCERDHDDLEFAAFTKHPIQHADGEVFTHWALCPANGEPILMRVVNEIKDVAPLAELENSFQSL